MTDDATGPAAVEWRPVSVVFALVLLVYVASLPRTVTLEDAGLFIMSSWFAGVSHPPGYPLHSLIGWLFTHLPVGSVAFRAHLVSAVFGAASCAVLAIVARTLGVGRRAAYPAAAAFGVSDAFWSQSIIAEVYSLNVFLFLAALALCLRVRATGSRRALRAVALVVGLGLSNHWTILVACGPALLVLVARRWRVLLADVLRLVLLLALGLTPYLYLVVRSRMEPPISFYGPIDSWEHFWFLVGSRGYETLHVNPRLGLAGTLAQARFWGAQLARQFTPLGAGLAALGAVAAWRRWPLDVAAAVTWAAVATPLVVLVGVNQSVDDHLNRAVFRVYPLVSYAIMALWIGVALDAVLAVAARRVPRAARLLPLAYAALPLAVLAANAGPNVRRNDRWSEDYARAMLDSFAPGATVFVNTDIDTGALGYLHLVEGVRPDVTLYNSQGLVLSPRLGGAWIEPQARVAATRDFIDHHDGPIYVMAEPPPFLASIASRFGIEDAGFYWRIDPRGGPGSRTPRADPALMAYLDRVLASHALTDAWSIHHRNRLIGQGGALLGRLVLLDPSGAERARNAQRLGLVEGHFLGRVRMVEAAQGLADPAQLERLLDGAELLLDDTYRDEDRALLPILRGELAERQGAAERAVSDYEQAVRILPEPRNPAVASLERLYPALGRQADAERLRREFGP